VSSASWAMATIWVPSDRVMVEAEEPVRAEAFENGLDRPPAECGEVLAWNAPAEDLHIVNVEGTLYRFESMEAGQPFVIEDSDGNVVVRDRGRLLTAFTVDTLGDDDLSNDIFIEGTFELLADNGRHPGFYTDFCDIATDLIG
jgi:hypothetical protein